MSVVFASFRDQEFAGIHCCGLRSSDCVDEAGESVELKSLSEKGVIKSQTECPLRLTRTPFMFLFVCPSSSSSSSSALSPSLSLSALLLSVVCSSSGRGLSFREARLAS